LAKDKVRMAPTKTQSATRTPLTTPDAAWQVVNPMIRPKSRPKASASPPATRRGQPAQARKLLAEAGYPNGFELTMYLWIAPGRPELPDLGEVVAGMWEQNLGLKVKRETVDLAKGRDMQVQRRMGQATLTAALPFTPEPIENWFLVTHSTSTAGQFMTAYIDKEMEKVYYELDDAKRAVNTREFGQFLYENYINVPIGIRPLVWVVGARVGEWPLDMGVMFVHNAERIKLKR